MENANANKPRARLIRPIVPIRTWLESEFYLGKECYAIRPKVKEWLINYFEGNVRDFIASGGSRTGKSWGTRILLIRLIYEMSCYENFPCLFGLSPTTLPKIIWFSFTKGKSDSTGIKGIIRMIDQIPYFQQKGLKRRDVDSYIEFPWVLVFSGSNVSHGIGEDLLGAVIDEADVRHVAKGSEVEEAQKMFQEIRQRSVMTFSKKGKWGGFSGIISSSGKATSFTAKKLEQAKLKGNAVVMELAIWDSDPDSYSKETFDVFVGNIDVKPFIVDSCDMEIKQFIASTYGQTLETFLAENEENVLHVPCSIREFFEEDLEFSIANMGGRSIIGNSTFIRNKKLIKDMFNEELKNPCCKEFPCIGIYDRDSLYELIDEDILFQNYGGQRVYFGADLSQKWDRSGLCGLYYNEERRKIETLLILGLTIDHEAPSDNQIDQTKILEYLIHLKNIGVNIAFFCGDRYCKDYLIPQIKTKFGNQCADYYSVDTDNGVAYLDVLNQARKHMLESYYYKELESEFFGLQYDQFTQKIDHLPNADPKNPQYWKDVTDAYAQALHALTVRENIAERNAIIEDIEHNPITSDGFFESISLQDTEQEVLDDVEAFERGLLEDDYGEIL